MIVKFLRKWNQYNAGEIAGFDDVSDLTGGANPVAVLWDHAAGRPVEADPVPVPVADDVVGPVADGVAAPVVGEPAPPRKVRAAAAAVAGAPPAQGAGGDDAAPETVDA